MCKKWGYKNNSTMNIELEKIYVLAKMFLSDKVNIL